MAGMIDHTLLKANATQEEVGKLCEEARKYSLKLPDNKLVTDFEWVDADEKLGVSQGFWMGKYEVTQGQWMAVMKKNPVTVGKRDGFIKEGDNYPVSCVGRAELETFIGELNKNVGQDSRVVFHLPSEAEYN